MALQLSLISLHACDSADSVCCYGLHNAQPLHARLTAVYRQTKQSLRHWSSLCKYTQTYYRITAHCKDTPSGYSLAMSKSPLHIAHALFEILQHDASPRHHKYSCISSSLIAAGVSTPRSVKSSDMNSAWQTSDSVLALQMQSMEHCVKQIRAGMQWH